MSLFVCVMCLSVSGEHVDGKIAQPPIFYEKQIQFKRVFIVNNSNIGVVHYNIL